MNDCEAFVSEPEKNVSYYYSFSGDEDSTASATANGKTTPDHGCIVTTDTEETKVSRKALEPPGRYIPHFERRQSKAHTQGRPSSPPAFNLEPDVSLLSPSKRARKVLRSIAIDLTAPTERPVTEEPGQISKPAGPSPTAVLIADSLQIRQKSARLSSGDKLTKPPGPNPIAVLISEAIREKPVVVKLLQCTDPRMKEGSSAQPDTCSSEALRDSRPKAPNASGKGVDDPATLSPRKRRSRNVLRSKSGDPMVSLLVERPGAEESKAENPTGPSPTAALIADSLLNKSKSSCPSAADHLTKSPGSNPFAVSISEANREKPVVVRELQSADPIRAKLGSSAQFEACSSEELCELRPKAPNASDKSEDDQTKHSPRRRSTGKASRFSTGSATAEWQSTLPPASTPRSPSKSSRPSARSQTDRSPMKSSRRPPRRSKSNDLEGPPLLAMSMSSLFDHSSTGKARRRFSTGNTSTEWQSTLPPTSTPRSPSKSSRPTARSQTDRSPMKSPRRPLRRSKSNDLEGPPLLAMSMSSLFDRSTPARTRSRSQSQRATRTTLKPQTTEKPAITHLQRSYHVHSSQKAASKGSARLSRSLHQSTMPRSRSRSFHRSPSRRKKERGSSKTPKQQRLLFQSEYLLNHSIPTVDFNENDANTTDDDRSICVDQLVDQDPKTNQFMASSLQLDISNPCLVETMIVPSVRTPPTDAETINSEDDMQSQSSLHPMKTNDDRNNGMNIGIASFAEHLSRRRLSLSMVRTNV